MNMSNPHGVKGRVGHGHRATRGGVTNRKAAPVRMTNSMSVMGKGRGGKKRSGRR
jgi:hypothetical protein